MNERVKLPIPEGELLPAEERLQNVLKAIEARMLAERQGLDELIEEFGEDDTASIEVRRFIQGLDIAWSIAKTESLRHEGDNR